MLAEKESNVLITKEACDYLRISRPTYVKYLATGRIRATKVGKGWKVLKSELDRFLRGGMQIESLSSAALQDHAGNPTTPPGRGREIGAERV